MNFRDRNLMEGQEPGADTSSVIIGRAEIAHRLGRSERTISRWVARGILPATNDGPYSNNLLTVRVADLEKLKNNTRVES
jgi:IS30 family transposase